MIVLIPTSIFEALAVTTLDAPSISFEDSNCILLNKEVGAVQF